MRGSARCGVVRAGPAGSSGPAPARPPLVGGTEAAKGENSGLIEQELHPDTLPEEHAEPLLTGGAGKAGTEADGVESCAGISHCADFIGVLRESEIQERWDEMEARNWGTVVVSSLVSELR